MAVAAIFNFIFMFIHPFVSRRTCVIGVVINDIHSLKNDHLGNDQSVRPCPVGSLPCDVTANESHQCLEERFWCDSHKDCGNGQDEDESACCKLPLFT